MNMKNIHLSVFGFPIMGVLESRLSCEEVLVPMFWTGDRERGMCSTLPGCDIIDRLEIVLHPSTRVVAPEKLLSPVEEMGPGSIMSPEITGRESEFAYFMSEKFEKDE